MNPQIAVTHEKDEKIPPRERLLAVAADLFYRHGIRAVGVDAITEAAGTNKMTLYRHFDSKDDLIVECLRTIAREADAAWAGLEAEQPGDPLAQLHGWVRFASEYLQTDCRGCDM